MQNDVLAYICAGLMLLLPDTVLEAQRLARVSDVSAYGTD
jgi:hypothetical protein